MVWRLLAGRSRVPFLCDGRARKTHPQLAGKANALRHSGRRPQWAADNEVGVASGGDGGRRVPSQRTTGQPPGQTLRLHAIRSTCDTADLARPRHRPLVPMTPEDLRTSRVEARKSDTSPIPYDQRLLEAMLCDPRTWGEASHVLPGLLARDDVAPAVVTAICALVRVWLANNPTAPHASFIVTSLLARDDLTPADAADAIRFALEWLVRLLPGPYTADTGRVLGALLWRRDTPAAEVRSPRRELDRQTRALLRRGAGLQGGFLE